MKLTRYAKNPILKPNPKFSWQSNAVFNPSVIYEDGIFHMLFRATGNAEPIKNIKEWKEWRTSVIGYAESKNGLNFKTKEAPLIKPEFPWEKMGCEDPRISKIGKTYYIFYTAVSAEKEFLKVRLGLAKTKDFKKVAKLGCVGPNIPSDEGFIKAGSFFPEKIDGKIQMLFTWHSDSPESTILLAEFKNIRELLKPSKNFWRNFLKEKPKHILIAPTSKAFRGPEVGAPPIKTKNGWLLIYCGESRKKEWTINAALLDLKNPRKVLWKSNGPILKPEKPYEKNGIVNNVTFPEGAVLIKSHPSSVSSQLLVYYGSGDKYCCLATAYFS